MIDAFLETAQRADLPTRRAGTSSIPQRPIVFVTAHRRENHERMREICEALREIADLPQRPQIHWPVHPSPQVAPIAHDVLDGVAGRRAGRSDRLRRDGGRGERASHASS